MQWNLNLAHGLLRAGRPDGLDRLKLPSVYPTFSEVGLPRLSEIPFSQQLLANHPLRRYVEKSEPLSVSDLKSLLGHPAMDLSVVGFHSGAIPAAMTRQLLTGERPGGEDYSANMWARDGIIAATALNRAGFSDKAHQVVRAFWEGLGSPQERWRITQYHFGPLEVTRQMFIDQNNSPRIKQAVDENGQLKPCNHDWGHQQIDALGALVWAPYRFANNRGSAWAPGGPLDLYTLDPLYLEPNSKPPSKNPEYKNSDSIIPATIKMFRGICAHDTLDYGPWEDIRLLRRATSVGSVLSALYEARIYHDREGWGVLPVQYDEKQDSERFRDEFEETLHNCRQTVESRIPTSGLAVESERRPFDSALVFLLYPFDCNLSVDRQNSILRTVYKNMGDTGFRRWSEDIVTGPDTYVGQDYFRNTDPLDKGEFAKVCGEFRPAEWTLFDPLLAAYYFRRFIESSGREEEAFLYGDRHLKRALASVTSESHTMVVKGKGVTYKIPPGILPEAYAWDTERGAWRPNHNSPLVMAQSALALAFERALEACRMRESFKPANDSDPRGS